jgi:hypothetical protein
VIPPPPRRLFPALLALAAVGPGACSLAPPPSLGTAPDSARGDTAGAPDGDVALADGPDAPPADSVAPPDASDLPDGSDAADAADAEQLPVDTSVAPDSAAPCDASDTCPPDPALTLVAPLTVRNDTDFDRVEVAYSAIPIPAAAALTAVAALVVTDATGATVPSQLTPLARWGGTVSDEAAPIAWLEVALPVAVAPRASATFALRRASAPPPADPAALTVVEDPAGLTIDTGAAVFRLEHAAPEVITAWTVAGDPILDPAASDSGPRAVDGAGNVLTALPSAQGLTLERSGPLLVTVHAHGHFSHITSGALACGHPLAYSARLTFERGGRDALIALDVRNECGDGYGPVGPSDDAGEFWGRTYAVREVTWRLALAPAVTGRTVAALDLGQLRAVADEAVVAQLHGSATAAGWRRAAVLEGGVTTHSDAAFDAPLVARLGPSHSVAATLPWMRFREPQAVGADATGLTLAFVSEPVVIGEAQARWGVGAFRAFGGDVGGDAPVAALQGPLRARLERGLLVSTDATTINAAGVRPRLPERATGARLARYRDHIEALHDDSVASWATAKRYGAAWPDTHERDPWQVTSDSAERSFAGSNYWSASASELAEYLRTGEPRWVWDLGYPLELTFLNAVVYNVGTRHPGGDVRSGFHAGYHSANTNQRTGELYRRGWNSDDYLYDQGSDEAYLVRPTGAILEVFEKACQTALSRYPTAATLPEGSRDAYVSARPISRGTVQHWNMLLYAAMFSRDPDLSQRCEARLHDVVDELLSDNLFAGVACRPETGNASRCDTQQTFMYSALTVGFLDLYQRHWDGSDRAAGVRDAIATMADQYYVTMMPKRGDDPDAIDVAGIWAKVLRCSFSGGALDGCVGLAEAFGEPAYAEERLMHLSVLLAGDALAPTPGRCALGAAALTRAWESPAITHWIDLGIGYWKGASQSMQNTVYGVGAAEACDPD